MLWIGIHLPRLSLEGFEATLAVAPEPADGVGLDAPVALIERHRLVAVNAAAQACGVRPGQQRATALGLAPGLRLGEADPARDAAALQAIAHAAMAFTPAVSIAPGHVVLAEVRASLRYFGGLAPLLARLRAALAPLGHVARIACAPTPQAAQWLCAWHEAHAESPSPDWRTRLDALPVSLMAAAEPHLATLQTLGLATLADLRRQPRAGLARRFGAALLADIDRALGELGDPRVSLEPPLRFDSRLELFQRAEDSAALLAGAAVLLNRLAAWAAARHGRIAAFALHLHHETRAKTRHDPAARTTILEIGLGDAVSGTAHLHSLLRERLQRQPLTASVIELSLHCAALVPGAPPNGELFPSAASQGEGWQRLLERLEARLGAQQVQRLQPVADHRPERATLTRPRAEAKAAAAVGAPIRLPTASDTGAPPESPPGDWPRQRRPVWLLREPQPLREQAGTPWLAGHPLWLLAGPERIETGWWDDAAAARDYFIAQAEDGALLWIYRFRHAPGAGESGWFLHGRYG